MKRILYFYPHKFSGFTDGIHLRIVTILKYFKSRGILVDMINFENPNINASYVKDQGLVENLFLVGDNPLLPKKNTKAQKAKQRNLFFRKLVSLKRKIKGELMAPRKVNVGLPNLMTASLFNKVSELVAEYQYDAVLVTYSYWADLIKPFGNIQVKKVIDPTDFLTLQQFYYNSQTGYDKIGDMFGAEIGRLSMFDDIIHISYDEYLLFSNFLPQLKHYFIPQFFRQHYFEDKSHDKEYDVLFIGSDNPYNLEGINWFLNEVYPLLASNVRISIAGKIGYLLKVDEKNIKILGFVDDSTALYGLSRITICPLKRGSGMKIKVVESLSHGLPVVSTPKGMDGFFGKDPSGGVIVASSPVMFAESIMRLVTDDRYYERQCEEARHLFEKNFSEDRNFATLDVVFELSGKN